MMDVEDIIALPTSAQRQVAYYRLIEDKMHEVISMTDIAEAYDALNAIMQRRIELEKETNGR